MKRVSQVIAMLFLLYVMVYELVIFPCDFEILCLVTLGFISYQVHHFLLFKKQIITNTVFLLPKRSRIHDHWKTVVVVAIFLVLCFFVPDNFLANRTGSKANYEMWIILFPLIFFQLSVFSYQNCYYLTHTGIIENISTSEEIQWLDIEYYEIQTDKGLIHLTRRNDKIYQVRTDAVELQMKEKKLGDFFETKMSSMKA